MERGRFYQHFGETSGSGQQENALTRLTALQEQGHPETLELISILYDAYSLQRNLQSASSDQRFQSPTQSEQANERHRALFSIDPPFAERSRRASLFVESAVHIMRGSFEAYPEEPEYLRTTLNAAFEPYGFEVAKGRNDSVSRPGVDLDYNIRKEEQLNRYGQITRASAIPEKQLTFYFGDDNQWETVGRWQEEPEVLRFSKHVNNIHTVYERMEPLSHGIRFRNQRSRFKGQGEDEAIPGLKLYVQSS
jgi:hypothetical protein